MTSLNIPVMKPTLLILLSLIFLNCFSQVTSIWRGNTPGKEQDWNCSSNWGNNSLPDQFTDVIIPVDISITYNYPVITDEVEVNSLSVWPGAILTIKDGTLTIHDTERSNYKRVQILGKKNLFENEAALFTTGEVSNPRLD